MTIHILNGLQLPAFDVEMLTLGKLIAVPFRQHINEGQVFWLYPSQNLPDTLSIEQYYQPEYLNYVESSFAQTKVQPLQIKAWARCEYHWRINPEEKYLLSMIAKSTVWNLSALEQIFNQYQVLKLLILRVYRLPQPCIVNQPTEAGAFYWPKSEDHLTTASENHTPVISNASFNKRKALLLAGELYPYQTLEYLQFQLGAISDHRLDAKRLSQDIKIFLGWSENLSTSEYDPDLEIWIKKITPVGNSSDGNEFERLVRKSLVKLGFSNSNTKSEASLDPDRVGGAGGLDFYCEAPYPVVGECKATKTEKVPDGTAAQLVKLGYKHLQRQYNRCIKIIMAAGELTEDAELTASGNEMNVLRPETLQRLVELKAKHPGSIDLLDLKPCLESEPFGEEADAKVNRYIYNIWENIKLRSHLIKLVKNANREVSIEYISGAYDASDPPKPIFNLEEMRELLIELSSPLTGYLGRKKGSDGNDRFYYLRDLVVEKS
ncbi:DUF1802 family protein [Phormidium sp. LEGE 05292]|uniref:DUF1802 family protein n=1 Tax=[Phormidium] sp. LEGE 05292 TaxID=767427 RepID=UPI00187F79B1|nr:DUF1802 family protein [Phormidium sp. LEGE 05292]MBE9228668.1 DUF1802 family protein [Phormidium sp. LEGE 05292]